MTWQSAQPNRLKLDADIKPNEGLGGIRLRVSLGDIQDLIPSWEPAGQQSYKLVSRFEARYSLMDGAIEVAVDVRNGKIFKLIAGKGYGGTLLGKIKVGMKVSEAISLESRLFYDEGEELITCRGVEGVSLDIPEIDPPPELVPNMEISAISVFAEEAFTSDGQKGNW
jgi:hypothetical protein